MPLARISPAQILPTMTPAKILGFDMAECGVCVLGPALVVALVVDIPIGGVAALVVALVVDTPIRRVVAILYDVRCQLER
jgi:uncharacterized membrane protein